MANNKLYGRVWCKKFIGTGTNLQLKTVGFVVLKLVSDQANKRKHPIGSNKQINFLEYLVTLFFTLGVAIVGPRNYAILCWQFSHCSITIGFLRHADLHRCWMKDCLYQFMSLMSPCFGYIILGGRNCLAHLGRINTPIWCMCKFFHLMAL